MITYNLIQGIIFKNFIFSYTIFFGIFSYIRFYANKSKILTALFFLPATFLHELLHFLMGLLLLAKPTSFSLIPKKEENGYTLGEVRFSNLNFFNTIPVALAPALIFVLLYYIDVFYWSFFKRDVLYFILFVYINFILVYSAIPSIQDFKVALSNRIGLLFWGLIITVIIYYFNYIKTLFLTFFGN